MKSWGCQRRFGISLRSFIVKLGILSVFALTHDCTIQQVQLSWWFFSPGFKILKFIKCTPPLQNFSIATCYSIFKFDCRATIAGSLSFLYYTSSTLHRFSLFYHDLPLYFFVVCYINIIQFLTIMSLYLYSSYCCFYILHCPLWTWLLVYTH